VAGDIACGGIPHYGDVRSRLVGLNPKEQELVLSFHRILNHVQHVELVRYHNVFNELDNQDIRIQYLLGNVTKEEIKVEVQKREKKREKERAMRRAMEVLVQAGTDIVRRLMAETDLTKKRKIMEEFDALRLYINELLAKIHDRLKLSVPQYSSSWGTTYPFSTTAKREEKRKEEEKKKKENEKKAKDEARRILEAAEDARINALLDEMGI
jgi:hypothetical protein